MGCGSNKVGVPAAMGRGETSSCAFFASVSPIFPQEAQLALEEEVGSLVQKGAVETVLDKQSPGFTLVCSWFPSAQGDSDQFWICPL